MSMSPEGKVKKKVRELLQRHCVYYTMPVTGGFGRQGAPDFICCVRGYFVGVECKAGANQPTALQRAVALTIEQSGGIAITIWEDNLYDLKNVLDNIERLYRLRTDKP